MRALLDDVAVLHDEDQIGIADGRQAMRDDERRAPLAERGHRLLQQQLGAGVDRRRRLVEDQHRRAGDERARDGDELPLSGRDVGGVFVEHGVVALGQRVHELVDARGDSGLGDLVVGGALAAVADVVADGTGEQPRVLQHHAGAGAHVVAAEVGDVLTVEQDATAVELVEPHDEVDQRGLPRAGGTDDRDRLAGLDAERQVGDERPLRCVGEADVLELDHPAALDVGGGVGGIRILLVGVEQREDALG